MSTQMEPTSRSGFIRWLPVLISLAVSPVHAWFAYSGFYELFVEEAGVHIPRVALEDGAWSTRVSFSLNTSTVTHFLILVGGATAILAVLMLTYHTLRRSSRRAIVVWISTEGVGFLLAFVASVVAIEDFLSSAGQFG